MTVNLSIIELMMRDRDVTIHSNYDVACLKISLGVDYYYESLYPFI